MGYSTIRDKYSLGQDEVIDNSWQLEKFQGFDIPHITMDVEMVYKTTVGTIETYTRPIWMEGTKEYLSSLKSDYICIKS